MWRNQTILDIVACCINYIQKMPKTSHRETTKPAKEKIPRGFERAPIIKINNKKCDKNQNPFIFGGEFKNTEIIKIIDREINKFTTNYSGELLLS
jgi:hypothetical protein